MVTFALIGFLPESDVATPRGAQTSRPTGARSAPILATPIAAARETTSSVEARPGAGVEPSTEIVHSGDFSPAAESDEPTPRLTSELAPAAPDVIVAMQLPVLPEIALAHAHLTDGAEGEAAPAAVTQEVGAQAGDDFQGPEPGALYWFGPHGLERVRPLGETAR
jgi:hypothetical protein